MQFKKIFFKKNVLLFEVGHSFYVENRFLKNLQDEEFEIELKDVKMITSFGPQTVVVLNDLNQPYLISTNQSDFNLNSMVDFRINTLSYPYLGFYKKGPTRTYGIYDIERKAELFETESWIGRSICSKYVYGELDGVLSSRSIFSERILWKFNINTLGTFKNVNNEDCNYEINDFVGVYQDQLFIKLKSNQLLVLDVNTGEKLKFMTFIDDMEGRTSIGWEKGEIPFFNTKYILDEKQEKIYGLAIDLFYEISIDKGNVKTIVHGLQDEFEKYNINPQDISKDNVVQNGKLYFLVQEQGRFAVLDIASKEIDYVSDPIEMEARDDAFTKLKEIQVDGDKVYVLGNDHVLHIFQKET